MVEPSTAAVAGRVRSRWWLAACSLSLAASPPVAERIGLRPSISSTAMSRGLIVADPAASSRRAQVGAPALLLVARHGRCGRDAALRRGGQGRAALDHARRHVAASPPNSSSRRFVIMAAWLFAEGGAGPTCPATSLAILAAVPAVVACWSLQPDFGQTMLVAIVWGALFFMAGLPWSGSRARRAAAVPGLFAAYLLLPARRRPHRPLHRPATATPSRSRPRSRLHQWRLVRAGPGEGIGQADPAGQPYRLRLRGRARRSSASSSAWCWSRSSPSS